MDIENPIKKHYDDHLAAVYSWMRGDFDAWVHREFTYFQQNDVVPRKTGLAIDMGCGHGIQSVALAELGFTVLGIDFSERLINEFEWKTKGQRIYSKQADFTELKESPLISPEVICCMGDTLPHFLDKATLKKCISRWAGWLVEKGKLVIAYREMYTELKDEQRFVPVRLDENRLFTCMLEYFPEKVRVNDLLYEKEEDSGEWKQQVSSYFKLRVPEHELAEIIMDAGLKMNSVHTISGLTYIIAQKDTVEEMVWGS